MNIKSFLPSKLLGRTMLIVIFPILMFQLIILSYYYNSLWERTLLRLSRSVVMEINLMNEALTSNDLTVSEIQENYAKYLNIEFKHYSQFENSTPPEYINNKVINEGLVLSSLRAELSSLIKYDFYLNENKKKEIIKVAIHIPNDYIEYQFPKDRINTSRNHIFLGWQIISSLLLILIAFLFLKNQIKPITSLAKAAEKFGKGQDIDDFKISGASEVKLASSEFIKMKNRILKQIEQRSLMLAGVSHDLKTPLTRMRLQTEKIQDDKVKNSLNEEIHQMSEMLNEYLEFSSSEKIDKIGKIESINPIEALIKITNDISFKNKNIKLKILKDSQSLVNANIFNRVVINILNNAVLVAKEVKIIIESSDEIIKLNIHDDGPGINDEEKNNVFNPFYRIDRSRNQNQLNSGLGLTIAKALLLQINGTIVLKDSYLGGLEVEIEIENK
tara:strand:+ start:171 stop:1502 length:1332 start_codon:yes stop_codon:yes gene_type:complete